MPLIYMVRHGEAAASWDQDPDPGLSAKGLTQARSVADELARHLPRPLTILSSPLRRCRETAEPLAQIWQMQVKIEPRVIEVPSPVQDLKERHLWLRRIMLLDWPAADETTTALLPWRSQMREALQDLREDAVIFTHFIAINAMVSHAREDARVVNFMPDNCSVTVLRSEEGKLELLEAGREMETQVN